MIQPHRRAVRTVTLSLPGMLIALLLVNCGGSGASSPAAFPVDSRIYFPAATEGGPRLARELRRLAGVDVPVEAVETMIAGPVDLDYTAAWNRSTNVLGVSRKGGTIEVNLSDDARKTNVGSATAALMVQQLVYTVTEAMDETDAKVRLLIEGQPAGKVWGAVRWNAPIGREDPLDVRMLVQIDDPRENTAPNSPFEVKGQAAVADGTVRWRVLYRGDVVEHGTAKTGEAKVFSPFRFQVDLPPEKTYHVHVAGESAVPGSKGRTATVDTKEFTLR